MDTRPPDAQSSVEENDQSSALSRTSSFSSIAEAILPNMQTTKEVWRKPQLHRDTAVPSVDMGTRFNSHRNETWYELFYDLVFVAGAIQIGNFMKYDISVWGLFKSGIIFAVLRSTWDQLMFYQNKFDTKDIVHHMFYLCQASCAFMMAMHLSTDGHAWNQDGDLKSFAVAAAVSRGLHVLIYVQVILVSKKYRTQFILLSVGQIVSAAIFAASAIFSEENESYVWMWLAAIIVERSLTFRITQQVLPKKALCPPHIGHLSHRQATFILLILGEAIIVLVQSNTNPNHDINYYIRGLMGFALVFNVGDVYYQQQVVGRIAFQESPKSRPVGLWTALHLFLSLAILYFAVGLKLVFNSDDTDGRTQKYEYLLCLSCSATLTLIFFIRMTHKGISYKGKRVRWLSYGFRFGISFLCAIVPLFAPQPIATIGMLFFFSSLLVLQDLFSHRGVRDDSMHASPSDHDSFALRETGDSGSGLTRLARVDNGLSIMTGNSDSFFFHDESFGRDKYLLERQKENSPTSSEGGSGTPHSSIASGEENSNFAERNSAVFVFGEKSRIFAGGPPGGANTNNAKEPLLDTPPHSS